MAIMVAKDITLGQTSVESWVLEGYDHSADANLLFLCVSSHPITPSASAKGRQVFSIDPNEGLYNLGWYENWKQFISMAFKKGVYRYETRYVVLLVT